MGAPEVLKRKNILKNQIFILRCRPVEILTGEVPYDNIKFDSQIEEYVLSGGRLRIPHDTYSAIAKLLKQTWQENPQDRISASEIMRTLKHCLQSAKIFSR